MYEVLNEFFNKENGSLNSNLKIWNNNNKDNVTQYIAEYLNDKYFAGYVYNPAFGSTIKVTGTIIDNNIHLNIAAFYIKIIIDINKL